MLINKRHGKQAVLLATTSVFAFTAVFSGVGSAYAQVTGVSSVATVTTNTTVAASTTITGTADNPVAVALTGGTLTNRGTIRGLANSSAIVVTGVASADTKIDNYGTIEASKTAGNSARNVAAIYLATRADIINRSTGVIKGTGGADGIIVATDVANGTAGGSTITNENGGLISSDSGNAISVYGPMRSITNSGRIISDTGTAIYIGAQGAITDGITNTSTGVIQGGPSNGSGKAIDASLSTANLTINNAGTIVGQILFGSGTDTLNITGGSITGNVTGDSKDAVNFNLGTGSFTTGGRFIGIGTINANSGTTTLAQAVTGATAFTIASGATVRQRASIAAATVTNSGTLDAGTSKQTITGNYVQSSTGSLGVSIVDATTSSTAIGLDVSGTASVAGKVAADTSGRTTGIAPGTKFTVITSGGTLASTATVDGTKSSLAFSLSQSGNTLSLVRDAGLSPTGPISRAFTAIGPSGSGILAAFNAIMNGPGLASLPVGSLIRGVFSGLESGTYNGVTLTTGQINQAFQELVPKFNVSTGSTTVVNGVTSGTTSTINSRIASVRGKDGQTGMAAGDSVGRGIEVWGQPYLTSFTQDAKDTNSGFRAQSRGVSFGADTVVAEHLRVGLAIGYTNSDVDGRDISLGDKSDIDSYQATLYASYSPSPWYVDVQLGYSLNQFDQSRNISTFAGTETAKGDFDSSSYRLRTSAGYNMALKGVEVTPSVFLQYANTETDGYTEKGSTAGSTFKSVDTNSFQSGIGLRIAYPIAIEGGRLIPEVRVGYTHEFNDDKSNIAYALNASPSAFGTIQGSAPDKNIYNVGVGLTFVATEKLSVSGNYDYQGSNSTDAHIGFLRVKYKF